jgi:hypothetical protein
MKRRMLIPFLFVLILLFPGLAAAQTVDIDDEGLFLRVSGDITVAANERIDNVIVVDGNAVVNGTVTDTLMVISGNATVDGTVEGDILMIDGTLRLEPAATVKDVTLIRATLDRADGATITGDLTEQDNYAGFGWVGAIFSFAIWVGVTLVLVVAALVFALAGGRQLTATGELLRRRPLQAILAGVALFVGLPILAVLAFVTIIGIPLGVVILLVVMPALWVLGYIVSGTWIGRKVTAALGQVEQPHRPLLAAALGVLILQVIGLIPALGPLVTLIAGMVGAGALVYRSASRPESPVERPLVSAGPAPTQA